MKNKICYILAALFIVTIARFKSPTHQPQELPAIKEKKAKTDLSYVGAKRYPHVAANESSEPPPANIPTDKELIDNTNQLINQGKFKDAIANYRLLLKRHPNNTSYVLRLGQLYVRTEKRKDAIELYQQSLKIDPNNQDVRIALAFAYLFDDNYAASRTEFKKVLDISQKNANAWAGLGYLAVLNDNITEAEAYYQKALKIEPNNITTLIYLGNLRLLQKRYPEAKEIFKQLASLAPDDPDVAKGFLDLQKALKETEKNAKPSQKNASKKNIDVQVRTPVNTPAEAQVRTPVNKPAEVQVRTPLNKSAEVQVRTPVNKSAEEQVRKPVNTPAEAKVRTPVNKTAEEQVKIPVNKPVKENVPPPAKKPPEDEASVGENQAIINTARKLEKAKDYSAAAALYRHLIESSPDTVDYYIMLGRVYISLDRKDDAIKLYQTASSYHPNDKNLMRAQAFAYLYKAMELDAIEGAFQWDFKFPFMHRTCKKNILTSKKFFWAALNQDPKDPDSLAGFGRNLALEGYQELAEEYYKEALSIDPNNGAARSYLAGLRSSQRRNFTARAMYRNLTALDPNDNDAAEGLKLAINSTIPTCDVFGYYEEENEKELVAPATYDWVARLHNYSVGVAMLYPCNNCVKFGGGISDDYIILNNLLSNSNIYSLEILRGRVGFEWTASPYTTVACSVGAAYFRQYKSSSFYTKSDCYVQPALGVTYNRNYHTITLETVSDSPIVARDFLTNKASLITRQFARGIGEYDFGKRRTLGGSGSYVWYHDQFNNNKAQFASAWLQITPPCYWQNFFIRYQFDYGNFSNLLRSYYTFQDQTTHWIKTEFTNKWYGDKVIATAGYGHGWQRSFEQGQVLVVNPLLPFRYIHREMNAAFARVNATLSDYITLTLEGTYSRDTFGYTTASASGAAHGRF